MKTKPTPSDSKTYEYVQELFEKAVDAREGYRKAANLTDSPSLHQLFEESAKQRTSFALELEGLLREAGIDPAQPGSTKAKAHQGWMSILSKVTKGDELLLNECYRGEEVALAEYESALEETTLPNDIAEIVERQRDQLKNELYSLDQLNQTDQQAA